MLQIKSKCLALPAAFKAYRLWTNRKCLAALQWGGCIHTHMHTTSEHLSDLRTQTKYLARELTHKTKIGTVNDGVTREGGTETWETSVAWTCQKTAVLFCVFMTKKCSFLEKQTKQTCKQQFDFTQFQFLSVNTCQLILCFKRFGTQPNCVLVHCK